MCPGSSGSPQSVNENHVLRAQHAHGELLSGLFYFTGKDFENWKLMYHIHSEMRSQRGCKVCVHSDDCTHTCPRLRQSFGPRCVLHSLSIGSFNWASNKACDGATDGPARPFKSEQSIPDTPAFQHRGHCEINSTLYLHLEIHYSSNNVVSLLTLQTGAFWTTEILFTRQTTAVDKACEEKIFFLNMSVCYSVE